MSDAYIDEVPFSPRLLERACDVSRSYAERAAEAGAYRHLLLVCGARDALWKYTRAHNGYLVGDFRGVSLGDPDERVYELFDRMQKAEGGHRDLAMSFGDDGVVVRNSVEILYADPLADMNGTCAEIGRIKGEVGAGHIAIARGSLNPGFLFGIGLSEDAGTVIPFVAGKIWRPGLYIPAERKPATGADAAGEAVPAADAADAE
ncbi:MAG: hypothetical protein FJY76_02160 [Candidatus Aenigmarchaeota archaeon]|nr:hypothetical protein [Candidatus Aenigmarchaeota archaeon]